MSSRRRRHFWDEEETDFLLQTLKEMNIERYKDGRKRRNSAIFRKVCAKHRAAGFLRSCDQVKHRWKTLKSIYYKTKRRNSASADTFRHYDTMEEIFGNLRRPPVTCNQTDDDVIYAKPEDKCVTSDEDEWNDDAGNGVDEEESGIQEIQSMKTEFEPITLTQPLHESSAPAESSTSTHPSVSIEITNCTPASQQLPVQDVLTEKSPCCNALHAQYQNFLERLQQTQNMWLERQLEQNHAREERLVARVLAEHTRSMEALINQLFTGLRSLLPHHQLQSNHHTAPDILNPHPHHINPTGQPAHNPTSSVPSQPEDCQ